MRLELTDDNKIVESDITGADKSEAAPKQERKEYDLTPSEIRQARKEKFKTLDFKGKAQYIFDYYKWFFIIGLVLIIGISVFVRDYIDAKRPVYLQAVIMNSNFNYDSTNTVKQDFIDQYGIDLDTYHLYIDYSVNLSNESFDTTMMAGQMKLVSMYEAGELDVAIGPVDIMENAANCDGYADLTKILPKDLLDELADRDYELYYYDPKEAARIRSEGDDLTEFDPDADYGEPYIAGIYLDNCSYLNNNGEYGAYDVATEEGDRPIFTIPVNAPHLDHAIEFLRFLIENR